VNRRVFLATLGVGSLAVTAGCTSVLGQDDDGPCGGDDCHVGMTRNAFVPETYEVSVGETVVWKNTSGADHTVTAYDDSIPEEATFFATGGCDSEDAARDAWFEQRGGALGPRETFSHTFEVPGSYQYVCIPHERAGMVGEILVSE